MAAYLLLWTLYGVVAKSSQDIHPDMAELIAWSRQLDFGYVKHPPLGALIVGIWFAIFPIADWSYYLLSILTATLALWIVWRLSADYLNAEKRVVGVALLTLVPFYNFLALTFNANTILLPLWAATTFWFLRSFKTHSIVYAALAGIGAAACLYAKYWSAFLLLGLTIAAVVHAKRASFFRSSAPWVTCFVCVAALVPHFVWLINHRFAPFQYALAVHGDSSFGITAFGVINYLMGCLLYVAVPVSLTVIVARPLPSVFFDMAWPNDPDRRLVALSFWIPLISPIVVALAAGIRLVALWSMPMWTLLPVVLLSSPAVSITRRHARKILAFAIALPVVSLLASPVVAVIIHRSGRVEPIARHAHQLTRHSEAAWAAATSQPLRFVDGIPELAYEVAAYGHDKPRALPRLPVNPAIVADSGKVVVCYAETSCARSSLADAAHEPSSRWLEVEISRNYWGIGDRAQKYIILVVPPKLSGN